MKTLSLAAALVVIIPAAALAQPADQTNGARLTLSAHGEVKTAPDMAMVTIGVVETAPSAAAALAANARSMNALIEALRRQGLPERDIQTAHISLSPQTVFTAGQPPRTTGYQAANQVNVTVEAIGQLGPVIDAAVSAGANQVNGIAFSLKDATSAEDEARRLAVKALAARASLYAQATGARRARLLDLTEGGAAAGAQPFVVMASRARSAPLPVEDGELNIGIDLTATYELEP